MKTFKEKEIKEKPLTVEHAINLSIKHWNCVRQYAMVASKTEIKDEFIVYQKLGREYCGLCAFWQDLNPNENIVKEICLYSCLGLVDDTCFDIDSSYQQVIDFTIEMNTDSFKNRNWRNILLDKIDGMLQCLKEYKKKMI